ncbi:cuticle protein 64-like [Diabrotica virgifera virgifera]|uniref:Cuticle protein 64-like n=1 Tax=Diabrotica virgifera virgifera TaxID=50390 RepID=A0A6P7GU42_DIAVI|nr:cuticle protein 64-like [Diabrotica virgifera virgifera]
MFPIIFLVLVASAANAGNIGIGLNSGGYGGLLGSTISQQATSTSIANSGPVAVAAAPVAVAAASPVLAVSPLAVASGAIVSVPTATSSQSRVDVINSRPLVSQVVSSVPVNVALGGGYGNGYGTGYANGVIDNGLVASAGLVTGSVNAVNSVGYSNVGYGNVGNGHGYRAY